MTRRIITADLRLLSEDDGGRSTPIASGYRSAVRFAGVDLDYGFELELKADLAPGDSGTGRLSFWAVDELPNLFIGQQFELREGRRIIGHGTVAETEQENHEPSSEAGGPGSKSI
jgi:elongation factor Tu